jgi:hypothetical protein
MRRLIPYLLPLLALLPIDESRAATTWMCGLAEDGVRLICLSDPDESRRNGRCGARAAGDDAGARHPVPAGPAPNLDGGSLRTAE